MLAASITRMMPMKWKGGCRMGRLFSLSPSNISHSKVGLRALRRWSNFWSERAVLRATFIKRKTTSTSKTAYHYPNSSFEIHFKNQIGGPPSMTKRNKSDPPESHPKKTSNNQTTSYSTATIVASWPRQSQVKRITPNRISSISRMIIQARNTRWTKYYLSQIC